MSRKLAAIALMTLLLGAPALAQDRGCDVETTSFVRIVPPRAQKSETIVALPQTPCPVLDTGPQTPVGPISIEVRPPWNGTGRTDGDGRKPPRRLQAPGNDSQ